MEMKTPEQLAEEYATPRFEKYDETKGYQKTQRNAFLAGYNARKRQEEEEHKQAEAKMEAAIDRMKDRVQAWWLRDEK
jgi:hypothetical protein